MRQEISTRTHVAVASLTLFVGALFLTAYSSRNPSIAKVGNSLVLELISPVSRLAEIVRDGLGTVWKQYVHLVGASAENERLLAQVQALEGRLSALSEFERENARLRQMLNFAAEKGFRSVAASVIGSDPSGWIRGIVIDRGSVHGVEPGMAVVHSKGIVGQVASVSSNSSRVLLVNDHSSGVDVVVQGSRARGVVEGAGERVCELKFITKETPVREGDLIITSGMDRVFPKGLIVGTIVGVDAQSGGLFQTVEVKPSVDFSRLEEVLIVLPPSDVGEQPPLKKGGDR
jgi:rod shape-determining protein MreC